MPHEVVSILMGIFVPSSDCWWSDGQDTSGLGSQARLSSQPSAVQLRRRGTPLWNSSILLTRILLVGGTQGQGPDVC